MGLKSYNVTEKTGCVADVRVVKGGEDVLKVADDGTIIRTGVSGISTLGRATQGVRIMRPNEGGQGHLRRPHRPRGGRGHERRRGRSYQQ